MKLWQKGITLDKAIEAFTVGNDPQLDMKLVKYDCIASQAHANMLCKIGILTKDECAQLVDALKTIIDLQASGHFSIAQSDEDCHTAIENYLVDKLGDVGKKIHTARSRNDQVLAALRLYYKAEIKNTFELLDAFCQTFTSFQEKHGAVALPGFTHTRKAMPSSIAMWSAGFIASMQDNKKLLECVLELVDQSPLGSGAGYGVPLNVDKEMVAKELGFTKVQETTYVQNSRGKFESSIVHAFTQIMFDLNKLATDLIMFSMPSFGFFQLPPELCTGSSIMPQKKNPDVLELVRGKYHTVCACEFEVKGITGNIISGYHRDMQLIKEPTMKGIETTQACLGIMKVVVEKLGVDAQACKAAMTPELFATEKAYELVKKGMPFRDAYKEVGKEFE